MGKKEMEKAFVYVSSWNNLGGAPGLGLYAADTETGELTFLEMINTEDSLNAMLIDEKKDLLYVCCEEELNRKNLMVSGRILTWRLDGETGRAEKIGETMTGCPNPAWLSMSPDGRYLFVAHHSRAISLIHHERGSDGKIISRNIWAEAAVQVWRRDQDGIPEKLVDSIDLADHDHGVDAHPHCTVFSPSGRVIAVADKGTGMLSLYTFDEGTEQLVLRSRKLTDSPGGCPRYVIFHPQRPWLFVNHEASIDGTCMVSAFEYTEEGMMRKMGAVNALLFPAERKPGPRLEQQGFVMSPDGGTIYTLINSANRIGIISVNPENGEMRVTQNIPVDGTHPRAMAISPDGRMLITGSLVTGELCVFRIRENGELERTEARLKQRGASTILFRNAKRRVYL